MNKEEILKEKEEDLSTTEIIQEDVGEIVNEGGKKPILMAKIENVYHEPFQMTQEVKVR